MSSQTLSKFLSQIGVVVPDKVTVADNTLLVDMSGSPTMRVLMDRAKVAYLTHLFEEHDGDRVAIAEAMGCTVQNVSKMLKILNKNYGD